MRELRLVGLDEDGGHVLLAGPEVGTVRLRVDDRLRAAVLGDRSLLGAMPAEAQSRLSVREMQARLRAGSSPEEVAAEACVAVESVRRFAGPVLDERLHVVEAVRRAPAPHGGSVAACVPDSASWDAGRDPQAGWWADARWDNGAARFGWDPLARRVSPLDDTARDCLGVNTAATQAAAAALSLVREGRPTPTSLPGAIPAVPATEDDRPPATVRRPARRGGRDGEGAAVPTGRRAAIPAWDDILFGARPPEE